MKDFNRITLGARTSKQGLKKNDKKPFNRTLGIGDSCPVQEFVSREMLAKHGDCGKATMLVLPTQLKLHQVYYRS